METLQTTPPSLNISKDPTNTQISPISSYITNITPKNTPKKTPKKPEYNYESFKYEKNIKPKNYAEPYEYFNTILKAPRFCVAPMVDASELPFRMLCRKYGAHMTWTPMLHRSLLIIIIIIIIIIYYENFYYHYYYK